MLQKTAMKNLLPLVVLLIFLTACTGKTENQTIGIETGTLAARQRNEKDALIAERL